MAAAQSMMTHVLRPQAGGTGVRVHSLMVRSPVKTRERGAMVQSDWATAEQLGEYLVRLHNREVSDWERRVHGISTVGDL